MVPINRQSCRHSNLLAACRAVACTRRHRHHTRHCLCHHSMSARLAPALLNGSSCCCESDGRLTRLQHRSRTSHILNRRRHMRRHTRRISRRRSRLAACRAMACTRSRHRLTSLHSSPQAASRSMVRICSHRLCLSRLAARQASSLLATDQATVLHIRRGHRLTRHRTSLRAARPTMRSHLTCLRFRRLTIVARSGRAPPAAVLLSAARSGRVSTCSATASTSWWACQHGARQRSSQRLLKDRQTSNRRQLSNERRLSLLQNRTLGRQCRLVRPR